MFLRKQDGPRAVTMPDGSVMTRADLPPLGTTRWVASRKAAVVRGVLGGADYPRPSDRMVWAKQ